jgi:hypothetical protein
MKTYMLLFGVFILLLFGCSKDANIPIEQLNSNFKITKVTSENLLTKSADEVELLSIETSEGNYSAVLSRSTLKNSSEQLYLLTDLSNSFEVYFVVEDQDPENKGFENVKFLSPEGIEYMRIVPFVHLGANYVKVEFSEDFMEVKSSFFGKFTTCLKALLQDETYLIVATTGAIVGVGAYVAAGTAIGCGLAAAIY